MNKEYLSEHTQNLKRSYSKLSQGRNENSDRVGEIKNWLKSSVFEYMAKKSKDQPQFNDSIARDVINSTNSGGISSGLKMKLNKVGEYFQRPIEPTNLQFDGKNSESFILPKSPILGETDNLLISETSESSFPLKSSQIVNQNAFSDIASSRNLRPRDSSFSSYSDLYFQTNRVQSCGSGNVSSNESSQNSPNIVQKSMQNCSNFTHTPYSVSVDPPPNRSLLVSTQQTNSHSTSNTLTLEKKLNLCQEELITKSINISQKSTTNSSSYYHPLTKATSTSRLRTHSASILPSFSHKMTPQTRPAIAIHYLLKNPQYFQQPGLPSAEGHQQRSYQNIQRSHMLPYGRNSYRISSNNLENTTQTILKK